MKGGSEIQFVADWLNINPIVTSTINPPLLDYKTRWMSYTNKAWAAVYRTDSKTTILKSNLMKMALGQSQYLP